MEGDIESEPLDLKNIPAIVNGRLVRVSVLFRRKKSTKYWEENGDCSPFQDTINGILVRFLLRFQEEDEYKSRETSAFALKSTKKWNFSKRKAKFGRYARHSLYYKSSSTRCPAAPTTQLAPPPPPPPSDLATLYSKRKISKADLSSDLTSSLKRRTQSETKLRQEIAAKDTLLQQHDRQQELRAKYNTKCAVISGTLMESRKAGRKCTPELKVSDKKVANLEELSEERVELFEQQLESTVLMKDVEQEVSVMCIIFFLTLIICSTKQSISQLAGRLMCLPMYPPWPWLIEN